MITPQFDCGSYSVYLYLVLSPSNFAPPFFFEDNIDEADALVLEFPITLQKEHMSP